MKRRSVVTSFFALFVAFTLMSVTAFAQEVNLPVTHQHFNFLEGPLTQHADDPLNLGGFRNPGPVICSTATTSAPNVNTDCGVIAPHNETSIAINPTNSNNIIGGANDYQLAVTGGHILETAFTRAHVSFDGGSTWTLFPIPYTSYDFTGDPAVAFDADGRAYMSTLGFLVSQGLGCCTNPDVVVSTSTNGGRTWTRPARVAAGTGSSHGVGIFNDKPYLTAWGHGNAIVTYTQFNDGVHAAYLGSPIFASVTHNGGVTWSRPVEISGSASFCFGALGGNACNQSTGSVPTVAADGSIYVAFINTENVPTFRDQYLVVKVDPATGQRIAGPFRVSEVVDGIGDYPINVDFRQTYQDSEFRTWALGNITADPTNPNHLAVVWSDMRDTPGRPLPANPYAAVTNSDIIVSQSTDGGVTWSSPVALTIPGDQFMPWGAYDPSGLLRIGYFDRSYDPANHMYGYTLATETSAGSLTFSNVQVTDTLSDPTMGDRWFAVTANPSFPFATTFLGDYSGIFAGAFVANYWSDMRNTVQFPNRSGHGEDAYFARSQ
jgi:hypothetical protein